MSRPRARLSDEQILDFLRTQQPVSIRMVRERFGYSERLMRERLDTLATLGKLELAPDRAPEEGSEGGRPSRLYALPDWPGLPANQRRDAPKVTEQQVLDSLASLDRCSFTVLHAALEAPLGELRAVLLGLVRAGRVTTDEHEGLTFYTSIA